MPDEQTWTMAGADPAAAGLRPTFVLGEAQRLLVPERLPAGLEHALRTCLAELPADVEVEMRPLPDVTGAPVAGWLESDAAGSGGAGAGGGHEMHGGGHEMHGDGHETLGGGREMLGGGHEAHGGEHGAHGHHGDMMAIVGEPSADGLVMEPIELTFGPLATPLPGGLAVEVTLDGDVVADANVRAVLGGDAPTDPAPAALDPLAPLAWTLVIDAAAGREPGVAPWRLLAALEVERAASHLAWLRALGRLLGWPLLVDRCTQALEGLPALARRLAGHCELRADGGEASPALKRAAGRADEVASLLARNRLFGLRTSGLGVVSGEQAAQLGLRGPSVRASGLQDDARTGHPLYEQLDFEPVLHSDGDAHARILVRGRETQSSLRLATAALGADADGPSAAVGLATPGEPVEGPRGPLRAERPSSDLPRAAPGSQEALRAAGEAMVGAEWSAALVALASTRGSRRSSTTRSPMRR